VDMVKRRGVEFSFQCADAGPVAYFTVYLHSGGGWYSATFEPEPVKGWQTIRVDKATMRVRVRRAAGRGLTRYA